MSEGRLALLERISRAVRDEAKKKAYYQAMHRGRLGRAKALQELHEPEEFRREVRRIKERSVERLEELVGQFVKNAEKRGVKVYLARDGEDACRYVLDVAKRHGVKLIAKSKSLTTEEIELNQRLEEAGITVVETDLGERIIQLAQEKPFHLVFPAVHKTRFEVADIFSKEASTPISAEYESIMKYVRRKLRDVFLEADMGITGGNVAIAETGTVIIETNEGNGRLVSSLPKVQVSVVGVEKVVESIEEALLMIRAHPVSATGQRLTVYVSFMSGRCPLNGGDDGREMHVVLLDNGRLKMREDSWFREALYCIRCGACMNCCPTYGVVGGHIFGHIYPGPIGIPWTANVHGLGKAEFSSLCVSCGLCKEYCPADIDIPMMIAKVKHQQIQGSGQEKVNRILESYEQLYRYARLAAPLFNWIMRRRAVRILMEKLIGVSASRPIPPAAFTPFTSWFKRHKPRVKNPVHKVVYFVDFFANYSNTTIAKRAVEILSAHGIEVEVPRQKTSGYPYIAYGDIDKAARVARSNVENLYPYVKSGHRIVSTEPTATYALRHSYPRLLNFSSESVELAKNTFDLMEYLVGMGLTGRIRTAEGVAENSVAYHISCHQRGINSGRHTLELLGRLGFDVQVVETGTCCGMAGSFGMKSGSLGIELSNAVGEPLFELFKQCGRRLIVTESSVCKIQLEQGVGAKVLHPLELLTV